jgi:REP element-mobilizing transposase RayT
MSEPLAFFITWTTFGSWLPGDERGWVKAGESGIQPPDAVLEEQRREIMRSSSVVLDHSQRHIVDEVIRRHCKFRNWELHALNVRTNHVHVVVTANERPERIMEQFKAWASRRLNEAMPVESVPQSRRKWWTEHGSTRWINHEQGLRAAIEYVLEGQ